MPFERKRPLIRLNREEIIYLQELSRSRTEAAQRVERAKIILSYSDGVSVSAIARQLQTNRPKIERCVDKVLQLGVKAALCDLPRTGKPPSITKEARTWVVSLACQKPKDFGYSYELWTTKLLSDHIKANCKKSGHSCLEKLSRGTVSKILTKSEIRPHKIKYYLEKRDPDFDVKMEQVLYVYREVEILKRKKQKDYSVAIISYDEKPGIQAIENTAPDLPPVPGSKSCLARDYEYVRHGTVSLMAGIDLLNGKVHALVVDRHRSCEFVQFLKKIDQDYQKKSKIRIILDNHSAHISKETRTYLLSVPNRFEFIFTPKHGSWLNIIESFFGKMARTMLRGIRVSSKKDLKDRIMKYIDEVNSDPVVFRWKYKIDSLSVA
jgi:transposase